MVSPQAIWQKKRYAEDPEYRERRRAENCHWRAAHKDEINERNRTDCAPIFNIGKDGMVIASAATDVRGRL